MLWLLGMSDLVDDRNVGVQLTRIVLIGDSIVKELKSRSIAYRRGFDFDRFEFFQGILEARAPQAAQKNINLKILSNLDVIVPTAEAQQEFTAFVQQVDKLKFDYLIQLATAR